MRTSLAILAACAFGAQAHAATIAATVTGSFGSFDPGLSSATATISNGAALSTFAFGGTPASYLRFQGYTGVLDGGSTLDTPFAIGDFSALKNPTNAYPATGTSVVLTTTLSFTAPVVTTQTLTYTLDIGLFPGLAAGTTDANLFGTPDIFPATFNIGSQRYDLALIGFDPEGEGTDLALTEGLPLLTQLFAQITLDTTPVPEPATLFLVTLPLLATLRRRRA